MWPPEVAETSWSLRNLPSCGASASGDRPLSPSEATGRIREGVSAGCVRDRVGVIKQRKIVMYRRATGEDSAHFHRIGLAVGRPQQPCYLDDGRSYIDTADWTDWISIPNRDEFKTMWTANIRHTRCSKTTPANIDSGKFFEQSDVTS